MTRMSKALKEKLHEFEKKEDIDEIKHSQGNLFNYCVADINTTHTPRAGHSLYLSEVT